MRRSWVSTPADGLCGRRRSYERSGGGASPQLTERQGLPVMGWALPGVRAADMCAVYCRIDKAGWGSVEKARVGNSPRKKGAAGARRGSVLRLDPTLIVTNSPGGRRVVNI